MDLLNFYSKHLEIDWIGFNIEGLHDHDPRVIAFNLSKCFTPYIAIDGKPVLLYHDLKKKTAVSIQHYTRSKSYWLGTQIIFSGKDAAHFYKLVKIVNSVGKF